MRISGVLESEVQRMAEAVALGWIADGEFREACRNAGINHVNALDGPLAVLGLSQIAAEGRA